MLYICWNDLTCTCPACVYPIRLVQENLSIYSDSKLARKLAQMQLKDAIEFIEAKINRKLTGKEIEELKHFRGLTLEGWFCCLRDIDTGNHGRKIVAFQSAEGRLQTFDTQLRL